MFIDGMKKLFIVSGPKDIARHSLIHTIMQEARLKNQGAKIQQNSFSVNDLTDHNIIIFDSDIINDCQMANIIKCANAYAIYVFGTNKDLNLHKMIPEADMYEKWISICECCHEAASFDHEGVIMCRSCRNDAFLKSQAKKQKIDPLEPQPKRARIESDSSSVLCLDDSISSNRSNGNDEPPTLTSIQNIDTSAAWMSPVFK